MSFEENSVSRIEDSLLKIGQKNPRRTCFPLQNSFNENTTFCKIY